PSFSPDDKRVAFLLNPNAVPNAVPGIWVMQADGSERRRAGEYGIPLWSPDGRQFLIGLPPKIWSSRNGNRTTGGEPGSDLCEDDQVLGAGQTDTGFFRHQFLQGRRLPTTA